MKKYPGRILVSFGLLSLIPAMWVGYKDYHLTDAGSFGDFSNWF